MATRFIEDGEVFIYLDRTKDEDYILMKKIVDAVDIVINQHINDISGLK